eukprot:6464241-Amphidinium_carterae.1
MSFNISGEWKGDWSDKSDMWEKNPTVKKALNYEDSMLSHAHLAHLHMRESVELCIIILH